MRKLLSGVASPGAFFPPLNDSEFVKKWGQAPASSRYFQGFSQDGRSQSPFFHKLSSFGLWKNAIRGAILRDSEVE